MMLFGLQQKSLEHRGGAGSALHVNILKRISIWKNYIIFSLQNQDVL